MTPVFLFCELVFAFFLVIIIIIILLLVFFVRTCFCNSLGSFCWGFLCFFSTFVFFPCCFEYVVKKGLLRISFFLDLFEACTNLFLFGLFACFPNGFSFLSIKFLIFFSSVMNG